MCGIAGFWQAKTGIDVPGEVLVRMGAALRYRGPDDSGTFFEGAAGIGLVHRRLAIVDLSAAGHQPMLSPSGRYVTVFNGEVYNFQDIREELGASHEWKGHSDTEIMLAAIDRWGLESAVNRFIGMFAFALWDRLERKLYLVRDRLGIKPLYYGVIGGDFVFASELKALRDYPGFEGEIDRNAVALYMRHNYVPSPHTIYAGICKLQPGSILALNSVQGQPELKRIWSATQIAKEGVKSLFDYSDAEATEQLEQKLREAVRIRMIADVPLGAFLSGGIDSSTIVALM